MTFPKLPSRAQFIVWLGPPLLILCILGAYLWIHYSRPQLEIVASAGDCNHPCKWDVTGRVDSPDTAALNGSKVWVEARTSRNDRLLKFADVKDGAFNVTDVPDTIQSRKVVQVTAHASYKGTSAETKILDESLRGVQLGFGVVGVVFLISLIVPFLKREPGYRLYVLSLVSAGLFAIVMIVGIAWGFRDVSTSDPKQVIPLAFGSVVNGTYSQGAAPEWLLMFGSPATAENGAATPVIQKGFGAPLWVLLISVVGCTILTVQLIVGEIKTPPKATQIRDRIQKVVRHQFFILFSPIGAIFVYQMVVIAGAADNDLTVALAALGSGVALNSLLNVAMRHARDLIEGSQSPGGREDHEELAAAAAASQVTSVPLTRDAKLGPARFSPRASRAYTWQPPQRPSAAKAHLRRLQGPQP